MLNIGRVTKPMGKINGDTSRNNKIDTKMHLSRESRHVSNLN